MKEVNQYFPIKTKTACQLKWTWSTIFLHTGTTNSCHRVEETNLTVDTFDNFHNTEKKLDDRRLMLNGQWPANGCEYCKDIEEAGGKSDRQFHIEIPNLVPPELEINSTAIEVTPRILEVYLDNTCNMSCIYCWDGFSSNIQKENEKHGPFSKNGLVIDNFSKKHLEYNQLVNKFYSWLDENYYTIKRLQILGGEPFFQIEFENCLKFIEDRAHPDLELNIVTNLKISKIKLEKFIKRIKQMISKRCIKRLEITASIDCWGNEQEYIRYGINMNDWQDNFKYLATQKWLTLNVNQVITVLTIRAMPELISFLNKLRVDRHIGHYFMSCVDRSHLYPGIFGANYFDNDFDNILKLMPDDHWQYNNSKQLMRGVQLDINKQTRNPKEILKLITFLDEIDRRRNLNWRTTFPWLEKEVSTNL